MRKEEMIKLLKEQAVTDIKSAEDTLKNIEVKPVDSAKAAENMPDSSNSTVEDVEKLVQNAMDALVAADADGISKNGGCDDRMAPGKIENERKREDNNMKDIINVSSRKVEEANEINNELLNQLKEAQAREESYKLKINKITDLCEKALEKQAKILTQEHAYEMKDIFEAVIAEGENIEKELVEASAKNKKMYDVAQRLYESSSKLNKILIESIKKSQPKAKLTRYTTPYVKAMYGFKD